MASPDFNEVVRGLRTTIPDENSIFEVRLIQQYTGYINTGYFNNVIDAANIICQADNDGIAGAYVTMNPVKPEAFHRCSNRLISARGAQCTNDKEILYRYGMLLDFDPVRPLSGISSTDEEHINTIAYAQQTAQHLTSLYGFPIPMIIDSGNGAHCRYYLEHMPNNDESDQLFHKFMQCAHGFLSTPTVDLDRSVFNASRITRIPGTPARKGEGKGDRPHRVSRILQEHGPGRLSKEQMELFVRTTQSHVQPPGKKANGKHAPVPQGTDPFARARAEYPDDEKLYRNLNKAARPRFRDWVPHLLGQYIRPSGDGYRLSNKNLNTGYTEDYLIDDWGIKDYGSADMGSPTEGRYTPITVLASILYDGDKSRAAEHLALILNLPMTDFGANILLPLPTPGPGMPSNLLGDISVDFTSMTNMYSDGSFGYGKGSVWLVDNLILADSLNVLNAGPKMGKSTFIRQLVAACMLGEPFLQILTPCVDILYVAYEDLIEDLYADIRHHMVKMLGHLPEDQRRQRMADAEKRLNIYGAKRATGGQFSKVPRGKVGQDIIKEQIRKNPAIKIVVADPVRFLFNDEYRSRNLVNQEYFEMLDIAEMAVQCKVSVIGAHHSNKNSLRSSASDDDPMGAIGGTSALSAAAQNVIIFRGDRVPAGVNAGTELYVTGRKGSTNSLVVQFHEGQFFKAASGIDVYWRTKSRNISVSGLPQRIVAALSAEIALTAQDLCDRTGGTDRAAMSRTLGLMKSEGTVIDENDNTGTHYNGRGAKPKIWRLTGKHKLIQY